MNYNFAELNAKEMNETNGGYIVPVLYPPYPYYGILIGQKIAAGVYNLLNK